MDKSRLYRLYGRCYNTGNFSRLKRRLSKKVLYESFDFLYKLKGRQKVLDHLTGRAVNNQARPDEERCIAHSGYFRQELFLGKRITECVVICRPDNTPVRIIAMNMRWFKVRQINGLDPAREVYTRGPVIG